MNFKDKLNPTTTVKVIAGKVPRIGISSDALTKMYIYAKECSDEIGWLGTVKALEGGRLFIIDDVYLFEQQVHGTTTEITPEGLASFGEQILSQPEGFDIWNRMQMWGHSHVNMGVTPSGQDDKQMLDFAEIGHDFFIRLICNKKGDMKLDFYDFKNGITFLDVPWEALQTSEENSIQEEIFRLQQQLEELTKLRTTSYEEEIKAEIKEKVSKLTYQRTVPVTPIAGTGNPYGYWEGGQFHKYEDEKKITTHGTTRTTMGAGTNKKKTNEIVVKGVTIKLREDEDYFIDDDEVADTFSSFELMIFSELPDFDELQDELEAQGWTDLTDTDVERIYRVAFKVRYGQEPKLNEE